MDRAHARHARRRRSLTDAEFTWAKPTPSRTRSGSRTSTATTSRGTGSRLGSLRCAGDCRRRNAALDADRRSAYRDRGISTRGSRRRTPHRTADPGRRDADGDCRCVHRGREPRYPAHLLDGRHRPCDRDADLRDRVRPISWRATGADSPGPRPIIVDQTGGPARLSKGDAPMVRQTRAGDGGGCSDGRASGRTRPFASVASLAAVGLALGIAAPAGAQPAAGGAFLDAQAASGRTAYGGSCAACHGTTLRGGVHGPDLTGPSFLSNWGSQTAAALYEYVRAEMPPGLGGFAPERNLPEHRRLPAAGERPCGGTAGAHRRRRGHRRRARRRSGKGCPRHGGCV